MICRSAIKKQLLIKKTYNNTKNLHINAVNAGRCPGRSIQINRFKWVNLLLREGFILEIYRRYKQIIFYLVFGALTTLVNIITYFICTKLLGMEYLVSSFIAWLFAVIFAYITNKVYVFNSTGSKNIVWEFLAFVGCRLFSGSLDLSMMYIMVDLLYINDLVAKVIANVVVIVLNYIFGKLLFLRMRTRAIEENESIWKKYLS